MNNGGVSGGVVFSSAALYLLDEDEKEWREDMLRYVLKSYLMVIPILLAVVLIVFTIMELTPGTPGRVLLGELAAQEEVDQLDQQAGYRPTVFLPIFSIYQGYCFAL